MTRRLYILLVVFLCGSSGLMAQVSIFGILAKSEPGKGTVMIYQPEDVRNLLETMSKDKIEIINDKTYLVVSGYRVQVFSGNEQRNSKNEVLAKKARIRDLYPDAKTYDTFIAPFWKLSVGDYLYYEEAFCMMQKLMDAFPVNKQEIHLIKEEVRVPLD
jgi:hypothetical protein